MIEKFISFFRASPSDVDVNFNSLDLIQFNRFKINLRSHRRH